MADARRFEHGGAVEPGIRLDFSASVNPLGPPRSVMQAVRRALRSIDRYPDSDARAVTERLAASHEVDPGQVVVGNGSIDLIYRLPVALRPSRVAIAEPAFTEYERASFAAGAAIDHWLAPPPDFQPQPFDPGRADLVWICNPNNPTGQLWPRGLLAAWIEAHPRTTFVVDEAFLPFLPEEKYHTLVPALPRLANLVVVRSLTKIFAFPGLRFGYAVLPSAAVSLAERLRPPPWSNNALALAAALAALADRAYLSRTQAWMKHEPARFVRRLTDLRAASPFPSAANFLLLQLRDRQYTAGGVARLLARRGIAVRNASNFVGLDESYLRVAVRSRRDNDQLVAALRSVLGEKG